ncbi:hypothetical protein EX30DRAFT_392942 [Ascodesmis nigricans]|uniref:Uncharacterized protein n=1 Tax=Ascodesmis nigricans TaxID=341454 RepID=A0A4S2N8E8_9PEZI|nr:hypothetical protein EX30DRAFT_392942 [Ascodesmis nigricans]
MTTFNPVLSALRRGAAEATKGATPRRWFSGSAKRWAQEAPKVPPTGTTQGGIRPDLRSRYKEKNKDLLYYTLSLGIFTLTASYASVPLYRAICQRTGYGGIPITDSTRFTPDKLIPQTQAKRIRVTFASSVSDVLDWKFVPQQREVRVLPGETALAFYTATNKSDHDIIGVATYSVTPGGVAPYFSKIQCFCFEEQKLSKGETVDMPVFFFIDPEFLKDPQMKGVDTVTLSYTFFKAKYDDNGVTKPLPQPLRESMPATSPAPITPTATA